MLACDAADIAFHCQVAGVFIEAEHVLPYALVRLDHWLPFERRFEADENWK